MIERLGSNQPVPTNFRLIVATAQHLEQAVAEGRFREDLYYRLNVVHIALPALRERTEDIPLLVQRFLVRSGRPVVIWPEALDRILTHSWPGNVRELENVIARAIALAPGGVPSPPMPSNFLGGHKADRIGWSKYRTREGFKEIVRQVEAHIVKAALAEAEGNELRAAGLLGIQRRLLYDKMREHGLR